MKQLLAQNNTVSKPGDIYKAIDSFVVKEDEKFKKEGRIIRGFHKEELDV